MDTTTNLLASYLKSISVYKVSVGQFGMAQNGMRLRSISLNSGLGGSVTDNSSNKSTPRAAPAEVTPRPQATCATRDPATFLRLWTSMGIVLMMVVSSSIPDWARGMFTGGIWWPTTIMELTAFPLPTVIPKSSGWWNAAASPGARRFCRLYRMTTFRLRKITTAAACLPANTIWLATATIIRNSVMKCRASDKNRPRNFSVRFSINPTQLQFSLEQEIMNSIRPNPT